jgi:hypothetical protein
MSDRPPSRARKRPESLDDLPFPRHPAVRWFDPRTLLLTGKLVAISSVFGTYADKREAQAAAATEPFHDHSGPDDTWIDYVSDLGDGFNATYTLAYLLAQPKLDVTVHDGQDTVPTTRGSVLVMGGDEVYPSASSRAYEERTKGPYNAAMPHADDPPALFAIPGNHDWYDGLTSFLRFFCQGGWVGGWKTEQRRSYFAVKLPQRWWLLGIDIQFDTYIDAPQIEYFRNVASNIKDGDGIILCNAIPSWVEGGTKDSKAYATLDYFITVVLGKKQDQVRLMLAGDSHHYVHYREVKDDPDEKGVRALITCGGGGAYLSATRLAEKEPLELPPSSLTADIVDAPQPSRFARETAYPTPEESRHLAARVFYRLPGRNPWFVLLMAGVQALVAYALVTSLLHRATGSPSLAQFWADLAPSWSLLEAFREPRAVVAALVVVGAMVVFSKRGGPVGVAAGCVHGLGHLASAVAAMLAAAAVSVPSGWPDEGQVATRLAVAAVVGSVLATTVVAAFLYVAGLLLDLHLNELFSAQSDEHHKSFLRMHVRDDGALVVHPLKVPRVSTRWDVAVAGAEGDPWLKPRAQVPVHLIEEPVVIVREVPT